MQVVKSWIVGYSLIVMLDDGTYRIGETSNIYGFDKISEEEALKLINKERQY